MPHSKPIQFRGRRRRWVRETQALWRDTVTLWREFRSSILTFLIAVVVGGYIYGELHAFSGREPIELIDRPYIMLQLMILETPYDAPPEWYLIIFWYLLPVMLVFIIGSGVTDFVRLFFNRDGRRNAWREALISTYRHHVIVLGAGHVGLRVVRSLIDLDIDVVVIDNSPDAGVDEILHQLQVPILHEDGRSAATLEKAGIQHADAFIACTGNDHMNLDVIMRVRHLNEKIRIVSRVWDDQFSTQIQKFLNVQAVLSSSALAAPVFAGLALGVEITQSLHVAGEDFSTVRLTAQPQSFLAGQNIGDLQREYGVDIVLHQRGDAVSVQPSRDQIVESGDTLVIFARHEKSLEMAARNHNAGR